MPTVVRSERAGLGLVALTLLVVLCAAYLSDLGHGFVKDDFAWIAANRFHDLWGLARIFSTDNGFYRPVVGVTFGLNHLLCDLEPLCFGWTNFALLFGCAFAMVVLVRSMGLGVEAGLITAYFWLLNPHGINMAVLWISGRTALLLVLFAALAAAASMRGRRVLAGLFCLLALLSKEEAAALPLILCFWSVVPSGADERWNWRRGARTAAAPALALVVYALLRSQTGAMLPWTAPSFYRPSAAPGILARNLLEYLDRAFTFTTAAVLVACLVTWKVPRIGPVERRELWRGLAWAAGGFALTVFLPVRSSLYVCFPSVGVAIAGAAVLRALIQQASARNLCRLVAAAVIVPLVLLPVYRSRNQRWVRPAELSRQVVEDLRGVEADLRQGRMLVLFDAPGARVTLAGSFGTLVQDAVRLTTGIDHARVWVEPPPPDWELAGLTRPEGPVVRYWLRDGRLVRQPQAPSF